MSVEERRQLVERNTEEVMQDAEEDELKSLLEQEEPQVYAGYEPSGPPHIGTWLTARKLLDAEEAGFQPTVLLADIHAQMNKKFEEAAENGHKQEEEYAEHMSELWKAIFQGMGLEDANFVRGSEFQEDWIYSRDLRRFASEFSDRDAGKAMADIVKQGETSLAQRIYPAMQALDIPYVGADMAVGGMDQRRIHVAARENLEKLKRNEHDNMFEKPVAIHTPIITSLNGPGAKMSSSVGGSTFALYDSPDDIEQAINQAYCPTDMGQVGEDAKKRTDGHWADVDIDDIEDMELQEANPLLQISKYFIFGADEELEIVQPEEYGGETSIFTNYSQLEDAFTSGDLHSADLKSGVAEYIVQRMEPVREEVQSLYRRNPEIFDSLDELGYDIPDVEADGYVEASA